MINILSTNKLSKSFMWFWAFLSLTLSNYGIHYFGSLDHNISFHMITDDCRQTIDRTDSIPAIMIEDDRGTVFDQGRLRCIIHIKVIPTKPALLVDDKRQLTDYVVYQASIWVSLTPLQVLSDRTDGWLRPLWNRLPEASKTCPEFLICGCKRLQDLPLQMSEGVAHWSIICLFSAG